MTSIQPSPTHCAEKELDGNKQEPERHEIEPHTALASSSHHVDPGFGDVRPELAAKAVTSEQTAVRSGHYYQASL